MLCVQELRGLVGNQSPLFPKRTDVGEPWVECWKVSSERLRDSMGVASHEPTHVMKRSQKYSLQISEDLAQPAAEADWEGLLSLDRVVDASLVETFRKTKLAAPRPSTGVSQALEAGTVELSTTDGRSARFQVPSGADRWTVEQERPQNTAGALLFGLSGEILSPAELESGSPTEGEALTLDRKGLLGLLSGYLVRTFGVPVADTGPLGALATGFLGEKTQGAGQPSPRGSALAKWACSMHEMGVPDMSVSELFDLGLRVEAQEADTAEAHRDAVRSGLMKVAATWPQRLGEGGSLPILEVSAELSEQLASRQGLDSQRAEIALAGQIALIMARIPKLLGSPGLVACSLDTPEEHIWNLFSSPALAGIPKTSLSFANFGDAMRNRCCVLRAPESTLRKAA